MCIYNDLATTAYFWQVAESVEGLSM